MSMKGKGYGFSIEREWLVWLEQVSHRFASGFDVRKASKKEDTMDGFDMELNFYKRHKKIRLDITMDTGRKHIHEWVIPEKIGWKSDRHQVLVVHAGLKKDQVLNLLQNI